MKMFEMILKLTILLSELNNILIELSSFKFLN
jgi:hypothetical protein